MKLRKILAVVVAVAMVASLAISASAATKTLAGEQGNTERIVTTGQTTLAMGQTVATITDLQLRLDTSAHAVDANLGNFFTMTNGISYTTINDVSTPDVTVNGQRPGIISAVGAPVVWGWNVANTGFPSQGLITATNSQNLALNISATFVAKDAQGANSDFGTVLSKEDLAGVTVDGIFWSTVNKGTANVQTLDGFQRTGVTLANATPVATTTKVSTNLFGGLSTAEKMEIANAGGATLDLTLERRFGPSQVVYVAQMKAGTVTAIDGTAVSVVYVEDSIKATSVGDNSNKVSIEIPADVFATFWDGGSAPNNARFDLRFNDTAITAAAATLTWGAADASDEDDGEEDNGDEDDGEEDNGDEDWNTTDLVPSEGPTTDLGGDTTNTDGGAAGEGTGAAGGEGSNPGTGVALAIVPALVAGAAVVVARKRK